MTGDQIFEFVQLLTVARLTENSVPLPTLSELGLVTLVLSLAVAGSLALRVKT
ncbi:MAG TPA: hypothetical protein VH854_02910 [Thermoanaerobaculia bacterium]|jgi:hypothetical protein|nr:hypothetical protein [Thermoanaerobaculia bacterium]